MLAAFVAVGPTSQGKRAERHHGVGEEDDEDFQLRRLAGAATGMGDGRAGGANRPAWLQQYELIGKIGEGTYGLVFLARLKPSHPAPGRRGPPIAIKKFKQSKEGDGVSPTAIREIMVCFPPFALLLAPVRFPSYYRTSALAAAGAPNPSLITWLLASSCAKSTTRMSSSSSMCTSTTLTCP